MIKRKWSFEEIDEYRKDHRSIFYFNKEDSNLVVPKAIGYGRTFNWANPFSWLIMFAVACIIIWKLMTR